MVGGVDFIFERPEEAAQHAKTHADKFFDLFDANGDDYSLPMRFRRVSCPCFSQAGIKVEKTSRAEFGKLFDLLAPFLQPKPLAPPSKGNPRNRHSCRLGAL